MNTTLLQSNVIFSAAIKTLSSIIYRFRTIGIIFIYDVIPIKFSYFTQRILCGDLEKIFCLVNKVPLS